MFSPRADLGLQGFERGQFLKSLQKLRIGHGTARRDASMEENDQGRSSWLAEWKPRPELASLRGSRSLRVCAVARAAVLRSVESTDFGVGALHQIRRVRAVDGRMERRWNWSHEGNAPMKNKHDPQSPPAANLQLHPQSGLQTLTCRAL